MSVALFEENHFPALHNRSRSNFDGESPVARLCERRIIRATVTDRRYKEDHFRALR